MRIRHLCFFLSFQIIYQAGCSVIGYGLGSIVDTSVQDTTMVAGHDAHGTELDQPTRVVLKNGSRVFGNILSMGTLPDSMYRPVYARWHRERESTLPQTGDSVTVRTIPGVYPDRTFKGTFVSFGIDNIDLEHAIRVRTIQKKTPVNVQLRYVEYVTDQRGIRWTQADLDGLWEADPPPADIAIRLKMAETDTVIALDDIDSILVTNGSGAYKWVGFGLGAMFDVAVLVTVSSMERHSDCKGPEFEGRY